MASHKKKNPKELSKHGTLTKAGQMLTKFLREIANEETELITVEGEDRMATKAEAMARIMWKIALGGKETVITNAGAKEVTQLPDKAMISLLFDRIEGKASPMADIKKKQSVADKVSEQGKQRISKAGGLDSAKS